MSKGGLHGGGRPKLETKGLKKRQTLSCRVKADAFEWLKRTSDTNLLSVGEVVDLALETLQRHPEEWPSDIAVGE